MREGVTQASVDQTQQLQETAESIGTILQEYIKANPAEAFSLPSGIDVRAITPLSLNDALGKLYDHSFYYDFSLKPARSKVRGKLMDQISDHLCRNPKVLNHLLQQFPKNDDILFGRLHPLVRYAQENLDDEGKKVFSLEMGSLFHDAAALRVQDLSGSKGDFVLNRYLYWLKAYLDLADTDVARTAARQIAAFAVHNRRMTNVNAIGNFVDDSSFEEYPNIALHTRIFFEEFAKELKLPEREWLDGIMTAAPKKTSAMRAHFLKYKYEPGSASAYVRNTMQMASALSKTPGLLQWLYESPRRIRNFARFDYRDWQAEFRNFKEAGERKPYFINIVAQYDWNGASNTPDIYSSDRFKLDILNTNLVTIEASDPNQLASDLERLFVERDNAQADGIILHAHSNASGIALKGRREGVLNEKVVTDIVGPALRKVAKSGSPLFLICCNASAPRTFAGPPIAHTLANVTGQTVHAAEGITASRIYLTGKKELELRAEDSRVHKLMPDGNTVIYPRRKPKRR